MFELRTVHLQRGPKRSIRQQGGIAQVESIFLSLVTAALGSLQSAARALHAPHMGAVRPQRSGTHRAVGYSALCAKGAAHVLRSGATRRCRATALLCSWALHLYSAALWTRSALMRYSAAPYSAPVQRPK